MNIPGFIGPSYLSMSKYASVERCVNFYLEVVEDPHENKSRQILYPCPLAGYLSGQPPAGLRQRNRGLLEVNGRVFGVNGTQMFEYITPYNTVAGTTAGQFGGWSIIGTIVDDGDPVSMIANGVNAGNPASNTNQQIFVTTSSGNGYIYTLGGVFTNLGTVPGFMAGQGAAFLDDFFISIITGTNGFQISKQNDGTQWDNTQVAYTQGQSDALSAIIADREYLWLLGSRRSEIWYNSGAQFFPFAIQPGAFLEIGIQAWHTLVQADNSLFWMGQDKRGGLSFWRANGLIPIRVSNHAVEQMWASYAKVSDAFAYSFLWRGHTFIRIIFPSANAGWTYDAAASQQLGYAVWHENSFTDSNGNSLAPFEGAHCYVAPENSYTGQGFHIIGSRGADGNPGALYTFTDQTIIDADPALLLRYSNDGGNTWGSERPIKVGKVGDYTKRARAILCGAGRDRVIWVRCNDYGNCPQNPDGTGGFTMTRDRISPHDFDENKYIRYSSYEFEVNKGIGLR